MIFAAGVLVAAGVLDDGMAGAPTGGQMVAYVSGFILLFILSGLGTTVPPTDDPVHLRGQGTGHTEWSRTRRPPGRAACPGAHRVRRAIGALGGVAINIVLRLSYVSDAKSATNAFGVFLGFYVICAFVTWVVFLRISPAKAPVATALPESVPPRSHRCTGLGLTTRSPRDGVL
jgi:NNP family nitrate/nitrite transporter-like MFS transporter